LTKEEFRNIYNQFFENIRRYLYFRSGSKELSTDIAQETFLKIWQKQLKYDPEKVKPLLYKIAGDLFVNHLRRTKIEGEYLKAIKLNFTEEDDSSTIEYKELKQVYEKALTRLPEKQRVVFLMSRMEELTYKEIAERLHISIKAVEKRMSLALTELRKVIQK